MRRNKKINEKTCRASRGFTLIEVLIAVAIVAIMAAGAASLLSDRPDRARATRAQADINAISSALEIYKLDNSFYPTTEQGLAALVEAPTSEPIPMSWKPGGYLKTKDRTAPLDPWNNTYIYRQPGTDGKDFDLISLGADKAEGGEGVNADITN